MSADARRPRHCAPRRMKKELPEHFRDYKHVWVFVEQERGEVHPVSWELLGEGRKLADKLGVELAAVVLGGPGEATEEAAAECVRLWRRSRLSRRASGADRLSQRALLQGDDGARQHVQAGNPAARRDQRSAAISPARSRRRC